jgi:hypothetical protein
MKWLIVVLLVVTLVGGVAVHGSRAAPAAGQSVAFRQCAGGGVSEACRALSSRLALGVEEGPGDYIGVVSSIGAVGAREGGIVGAGGDISPDRWVEVALAAIEVARVVFQNWDRFFGNEMARVPVVPVLDGVFDPAG